MSFNEYEIIRWMCALDGPRSDDVYFPLTVVVRLHLASAVMFPASAKHTIITVAKICLIIIFD